MKMKVKRTIHRMMFLSKKYFFQIVIIVSIIFAFTIQFYGIRILKLPENYIKDNTLFNVSSRQNQEKIALVLVGDKTINDFSTWPIDRSVYAKLLDDNFATSKIVVFDLLFPNKTTSDERFAKAIKDHGRVVLAYVDKFDHQEPVTPAYTLLENSSRIGYVNYFSDSDGYARDYKLFNGEGTLLRPSLVMSIVEELSYKVIKLKDQEINIIYDNEVIFRLPQNTNGKFRVLRSDIDEIEIYELSDIYNGIYSKDVFDDKIVLIGGSFTGASDTINTPVNTSLGVKFINDALNTLLSGRQPVNIPRLYQAIVVLLLLVILTIITLRIKPLYSSLLVLVMMSALIATYNYLATTHLLYFDIVHMLSVCTIYFINLIVLRAILSDRHNKKLNLSFEHILEIEKFSINDMNFESYIEKINAEVMIENDLNIIGVYSKEQLEALNLGPIAEQVVIDKKNVIVPILRDEDIFYVLIEQLKRRKVKELNYIVALIASSNAFFSNRKLIQKKNQMFYNIFRSLVSAIDAKDPITSNHSERVADISVRIGKLLGYSDKRNELLHFSGLIHDVGKIGISENVLNKPCFYSGNDFEEMKRHPYLGSQILKVSEVDKEIYNTILQHHERIDGKGYPNSLKGDEISDFAKIVKIADVYDALCSKRQYKDAWAIEKVCCILEEGSGTEFDPTILKVFLDSIKQQSNDLSVVKEIADNQSTDILSSKVLDILDKCLTITRENSEIGFLYEPLLKEEFFFSKPISYCDIQFGEHISSRKWLNKKPRHAMVDEDEEYDYYTLMSDGQWNQSVFIFYKGYLNGLYLHSDDSDYEALKLNLEEGFGAAIVSQNNYLIWDCRDVFIFLKEEKQRRSNSFMIIHKYSL